MINNDNKILFIIIFIISKSLRKGLIKNRYKVHVLFELTVVYIYILCPIPFNLYNELESRVTYLSDCSRRAFQEPSLTKNFVWHVRLDRRSRRQSCNDRFSHPNVASLSRKA